MQKSRDQRSRDSKCNESNRQQVKGNERRIDNQTHVAVRRREAPTSDNEGRSCFKTVVVASPVWHPRTGTEAEKDNENVSFALFYHALSPRLVVVRKFRPLPGDWTRVRGEMIRRELNSYSD
jgi:hypothetical protein